MPPTCDERGVYRYRGYRIDPEDLGPPGTRFAFQHEDYDGPGDTRHGVAKSVDEAMALIDEQLDEANPDDIVGRMLGEEREAQR